jgi:hypothetical protein
LAVDALCYRKTPRSPNNAATGNGSDGATSVGSDDEYDDVIIELNDTAIGILSSQWMVLPHSYGLPLSEISLANGWCGVVFSSIRRKAK